MLIALGAELVYATEADDTGSYLRNRLAVRDALVKTTPHAWCPDQYRNKASIRAHYYGTGAEIVEAVAGRLDVLVVATGTGGTISGCARMVKKHLPGIRIVAADAIGSKIFDKEATSFISAKRTAASAALGARQLWPHETVTTVGMVGCGLINYETLRFLLAVFPMIEAVHLYDLSAERAAQFCTKAQSLKPGLHCQVEDGFPALLERAPVLSLATTAVTPHTPSLAGHQEHAVMLHVSLRDFTADVILQADNVVDDIDKASSNNTSVHLAEQRVGHRDFIRTTIGDILNGDAPRRDLSKPFAIYSPFGLDILDLAVADLVYQLAQAQHTGTPIENFLPPSWLERSA